MLGLTENLQVDNYHGLGYTLYDAQDCATDQGLKRIVLEDTRPVGEIEFDLLCLDELQDATPIIYAFIRKLIRDNKSTKNLQYLVLGDPRQVFPLYSDVLTSRKSMLSIMRIKDFSRWRKRRFLRLENGLQ
jgi:hypothetical protein